MTLIDTHTHLYLEQFDADRDDVIKSAIEAGVKYMFLPNIDSGSIKDMLKMEEDYPDHCFPMIGLHPTSVKENYKEELAVMYSWLEKKSFCAIGEIGIDLYWDKTFFEEQKKAFLTQVSWARDRNLPVAIHCRDSIGITIELLEALKDPDLKGVFHCFSGTEEQAKRIIDLGFFLGIGGVLTFKNSGLDKVIKNIPLKTMILETDSPFLAPVPHRGKRNESANVSFVAEKLVEVKDVSYKVVAEITTANAKRLFGMDDSVKGLFEND